MSHELFGERFLAREKGGWHGLGTTFDKSERVTASEAIMRARMTFEIGTKPLLVDLGGVLTSYGKVAIVREPTDDDPEYRVFGEASEGYTVLQNAELAQRIDPLCEQWPVETCGALEHGMTMFLTLDAGDADVAGDPVHQYFLIDDTRDGMHALSVSFTPVRVVCKNTLVMGKEAAIASANLRHVANVDAELQWRVKLLKEMQDVQHKIMSSFEQMAHAVLSAQQANGVLALSYPYMRKPRKVEIVDALSEDERLKYAGLLSAVHHSESAYAAQRERMEERRNAAKYLYERFNDEQPDLARTAWAAYNAVVECEDYREAVKVTEDPLVSALFGERARTKERAYAACMKATLEPDELLVPAELLAQVEVR